MQPDLSALGMDLLAIAPVVWLGAVAMLVLILGLFVGKEQSGLLAGVALAGLAAGAIILLGTWSGGRLAFGKMMVVDGFYVFLSLLALGATALAILLSVNYVGRSGLAHPEYYGLLIFGAAGMLVMASASNLIVLLIGLELLSLSLYVLAGFARTRLTSEEAALKYFLLGAFSFGLMLYGSALVYGATGSLDYSGIAAALKGRGEFDLMLLVGAGLLLVGFAFKLALAPFHMWVPDVYEGAPTPVTAFMAVGTKAIVFASLLRLLVAALPQLQSEWAPLVAGGAAITMIVGNVAAVVQGNIKRLLAYSAIAHAGYIAMAVLAGPGRGSDAVLFYLVAYTVMNFGAFAVIVAVGDGREDRLSLEDYSGLARRSPALAAAMALFMLSMAGVPPTVGFMAKLYVFTAAVEAGYLWLALIGIATSVISVYYYLRVVAAMYMSEPSAEIWTPKSGLALSIVLVVAVFFTLQLGVLPGLLPAMPQIQALGL